ncbi:MAG: universal stress protein [Spirochaetales bacterium]|nr:MAG: universal stress protein [Spirochaetales bacterium]
MYKKILLLIDCSDVDDVILKHVTKLAKFHKASVSLFHVVHAHTLDQRRILQAKAEICLSRSRKALADEGVGADYSLAEGEPSEQILQKLSEAEFDLVALATHGHRFFGDFVLGSVSKMLKHNCDVPILLIRGEKK